MSSNYKREFDDGSNDSREERRRKRKSRWGGNETDKIIIPGLPTIMPSNLTKEQQEMYLLQIKIETITKQLRTGELGIPDDPDQRSPSPEPIYNSDGKRLNTREFRVRKKLEEERHQLISKMITLNPFYSAPLDYKPPQTKLSDKVLIPQEEYPDINFVGLLIGPRGNTLKAMEKDTGAKIIIRGKGSIKEGKLGRKDGQPLPGEDEPLHAFLTAPTEDAIAAATKQIMKIINQAIELPENQNNLRRTQLRELALLNGTLRENDVLSKRFCSNCGSVEHRNWQCPEKTNMVNTMLCTKCNGKGHLEKDCKYVPENGADAQVNSSKIDEEYFSFMAELGECSPPPSKLNSSSTSTTNTAVTNSTTTADRGGPLALTYDDKITETKNNSEHVLTQVATNQNGSSNAPLLPTPGSSSTTSSSDKSKLVTWIQKQGVWKQVVQDAPEPSTTLVTTDQPTSTTTSSSDSSTNNSSPIPAYISADPLALSYYNAYLQQAITTGQDLIAANATALANYTAWATYAGYVPQITVPTTDPSTSKYSEGAYNAVPPPNQIMAGTTIAAPNSSNYNAVPSSYYGYGLVPPTTSVPANNSGYPASNYSLYGYGGLTTSPPPPPE